MNLIYCEPEQNHGSMKKITIKYQLQKETSSFVYKQECALFHALLDILDKRFNGGS